MKHSKMIDDDIKTYTKEYLHSIKNKAVERVRQAVESGEKAFVNTNISNSGLDLSSIKKIVQDYINRCDFLVVRELINKLGNSNSDHNIKELGIYFEIVWSFYCDRTSLDNLVEKYIETTNKQYINDLCELFVQFNYKKPLKCLIEYCTDDKISSLAKHIVDDTVEGYIIHRTQKASNKINERKTASVCISKVNSLLHKFVTNYCIDNSIEFIVDENGNNIELYKDETYYNLRVCIHNLSTITTRKLYTQKQSIENSESYKKVLENIDTIKLLDTELQIFFYGKLLFMATSTNDNAAYDRLLAECNPNLRENVAIKEIEYFHTIHNKVDDIKFDEIRQCCERSENYSLCIDYLCELMCSNSKEHINKVKQMFNENKYFLKKSSEFLKYYMHFQKDILKSNVSTVKILEEYRDTYKDKMLYNILIVFYLFKKKDKDKKNKYKRALDWIVSNINQPLQYADISMLITVLGNAKKFDELVAFDKRLPPNLFRLQIAAILSNTNNIEYVKYAKDICLQILENEPNTENICRDLYICYYKLGEYDNSKRYARKQIDYCNEIDDIGHYMQMKINIQDFEIDSYVVKASEFCNCKLDVLLAHLYYCNKEYDKSKTYLIRSLLVDDKNVFVLNNLMQVLLQDIPQDYKEPEKVDSGVTIALKDIKSNKILQISIHDEKEFPKYEPKNFAGCIHYKASDRVLENLLFTKMGDEISYKNNNYKVVKLDTNDIIYFRYAMMVLEKHGVITVFYKKDGESEEQSIKNLVDIVQSMNEKKKKIVESRITIYNKNNGVSPLTLLSQLLGKANLEILSFLFFDNESKINNLSNSNQLDKDSVFCLAMDTLFALSIMDIELKDLANIKCFIPQTTKRILQQEVSYLIDEVKNDSNVGRLFFVDDKVILDKDGQKRENIKILNRLKNLIEISHNASKNIVINV